MTFDRYPRSIVRRILRGRPQPGGHTRVFLNLREGLDRLGVEYRVNDYRNARRRPTELVCIIGKPHMLDVMRWRNPIVFGAAVHSHPIDDPLLLGRLNVKRVLVPGEWMRKMCEPYYGNRVTAWPVGIDTDLWAPDPGVMKDIDILLYDKVRWQHGRYETELIQPILDDIRRRGLCVSVLRYGEYRESEYHRLIQRAKAMVFLCEHETQGIAYQQALSADVPLFAWDRGGLWQDPSYYPSKVQFEPVSSVPYWDDRCGMTFVDIAAFRTHVDTFWDAVQSNRYTPRSYALDNLTLEHCARQYVNIVRSEEESC